MNAKPTTIPAELLALMAEKFRMLGEPTRLAILHCMMGQQELNVGQIVNLSGRQMANVSKHLKLMSDAGLVSRRRQGAFVLYRLNDPVMESICKLVCDSLRRELEAEFKKGIMLLKRSKS